MRRLRHNAILELVRSGEITSQEDLMRGLKARNITVSQSTLSRDIQELLIAKAGGVYTVVDAEPAVPHSEGSLARIIREFMVDVDVRSEERRVGKESRCRGAGRGRRKRQEVSTITAQ